MKTVCLDARMIKSSGIGRYIRNLIPFLAKEFNLILLVREKIFLPKEETISIKEIDIPIYSIKEQIFYPFKIPKVDIFWSPHYNVPLLPIRAKKRLVTIHDVYHLAFKKQLPFAQKMYAFLMLKAAVNLSDVILTVSNFSKTEIEKFLKPKKTVKVVYNGLSGDWFEIKPIPQNQKENYILFVGNVKPHKNLVRALKAFTLLLRENKNLKFKIVGKKDGFINADVEVKKLAQKLGNSVEFTGEVSEGELKNLYRKAKLLIFPSIYEGFGYPPLEAMACGTPVVASNAASIPEVCGEAAYYVNPYDIRDIYRGLKEVLNNNQLQEELIRKGFQRIKKFSLENSAKEIIQLLHTL